MRYFILFMLLSSVCFADSYILYDKDTLEIQSISCKDDAVQKATQEKAFIKENLELTYPQECYVFQNGKVKLDMKKVEKKAREEEKIRKKYNRLEKIRKHAEYLAEQDLIALGELEVE